MAQILKLSKSLNLYSEEDSTISPGILSQHVILH